MISRRVVLGSGVAARFLVPGDPALAANPARPSPGQPGAPLPLILLDPGHGGKDPGAIGVSGTYEKHVALAAAAELRRLLLSSGRYRVELSRTRDVFIPLEDRVAIAQHRGAALFVSMHADALADHSVRGASVYTLSDTASDAQTAALAQRENSADRFAGPAFRNTSPEVARILASLVRQETRVGSARMARDVVGQLGRDVPLLQNPARHAAFIVLKAPDIPSVLVEMGFMSNREDEAALRRPDHRVLVATAMKRAIDAWFERAFGGTRMAG
jgi:N-acetylmuramoyl-L-alanine amidase